MALLSTIASNHCSFFFIMLKVFLLQNFVLLNIVLLPSSCRAFVVPRTFDQSVAPPPRTCQSMGILDSISSFLENREGDFVKLEDSGTAVGPGPLLLLFNLPPSIGIENDEYQDMVEDGAPNAFAQGVIIAHISSSNAEILDKPLSEALEQIVGEKGIGGGMDQSSSFEKDKSSVLFFSGFANEEMMATYNIIGKELYEESGGAVTPACAKAVVNAMEKPLRQVLDEISGDHEEAMSPG